jgi:hypothetical protein
MNKISYVLLYIYLYIPQTLTQCTMPEKKKTGVLTR